MPHTESVQSLAHEINGNYLAARRYCTPLFRVVEWQGDGEPDHEMAAIANIIFQMGVNAAHAWYVLRREEARGDASRALADARLLRADTFARSKRLRRAVQRRWGRERPGERYAWDPHLDLGLRDRKKTFRAHRGHLPAALATRRREDAEDPDAVQAGG